MPVLELIFVIAMAGVFVAAVVIIACRFWVDEDR